MRINIDSMALKDPRFKRLGRALGKDWHHALGLCLELWMFCSDQKSEYLSASDVDAVVEVDGFGQAMLTAELAIEEGGRLRIRGVRDRIEYLHRQKESASAGGKASAAKRQASKIEALEPTATPTAQATAKRPVKRGGAPLTLDLPPDLPLPPDQDRSQDHPPPEPPEGSTAARSRVPVGTPEVIAFFCDLYKNKHSARCTVTDKARGQLKHLVGIHGPEEVKRRITNLFESPPRFLSDSAHDIGTLVQHFDKLVARTSSAASNGRPVGRAEPASADAYERDAAELAANGGRL